MAEPIRCDNCQTLVDDDRETKFYECCGMDLCKFCQHVHYDICPVSFIECRGEPDGF